MGVSPYGSSTCTFVQHGTFPLYDVVARIVDLDKLEASIKAGTGGDPDTFTVMYNVGNLAVNGLSDVGSLVKLEGDKKRLNIFFRARNGSFIQLLRITKAAGSWHTAYKVERYVNNEHLVLGKESPKRELLLTVIDDGYPREADGSINWE
jgi:hypothetical protein